MKNEEQEAALQALSHAHHEELHRILMETCHEGEGSALRSRLLELQESLEEQHRVGAQVCVCVCVCVCVDGWVHSYPPDHEINRPHSRARCIAVI